MIAIITLFPQDLQRVNRRGNIFLFISLLLFLIFLYSYRVIYKYCSSSTIEIYTKLLSLSLALVIFDMSMLPSLFCGYFLPTLFSLHDPRRFLVGVSRLRDCCCSKQFAGTSHRSVSRLLAVFQTPGSKSNSLGPSNNEFRTYNWTCYVGQRS